MFKLNFIIDHKANMEEKRYPRVRKKENNSQ